VQAWAKITRNPLTEQNRINRKLRLNRFSVIGSVKDSVQFDRWRHQFLSSVNRFTDLATKACPGVVFFLCPAHQAHANQITKSPPSLRNPSSQPVRRPDPAPSRRPQLVCIVSSLLCQSHITSVGAPCHHSSSRRSTSPGGLCLHRLVPATRLALHCSVQIRSSAEASNLHQVTLIGPTSALILYLSNGFVMCN
jgi:hypothetical protein